MNFDGGKMIKIINLNLLILTKAKLSMISTKKIIKIIIIDLDSKNLLNKNVVLFFFNVNKKYFT